MSVAGVNVLYAAEAAEEPEWTTVGERDRTKRLREVYWARRAESHVRPMRSAGAQLKWRCDRGDIDRGSDDPGDGFAYLATISTQGMEAGFEWFEVTEVFTTVPPQRIEAAMQAWNGLAGRQPGDLEGFLEGLDRGRPSRAAQRRAADRVIAQVGKKLAKSSYDELLGKYGYGTLVVGLPLWFATPPMVPLRAENALDEFDTRTKLGLDEVRRSELERRDCPFKQVIVLWEPTLDAMREWSERRSSVYDDIAITSLAKPFSTSLMKAVLKSEPESIGLHATAKSGTKRSGMGAHSETGKRLQAFVREQERIRPAPREKAKRRLASLYLKVDLFVRIRGMRGLRRWILGRCSLPRLWKVTATVLRARRLYRESVRRSGFGRGRFRDGRLARHSG